MVSFVNVVPSAECLRTIKFYVLLKIKMKTCEMLTVFKTSFANGHCYIAEFYIV